jgi:hypothetical protein
MITDYALIGNPGRGKLNHFHFTNGKLVNYHWYINSISISVSDVILSPWIPDKTFGNDCPSTIIPFNVFYMVWCHSRNIQSGIQGWGRIQLESQLISAYSILLPRLKIPIAIQHHYTNTQTNSIKPPSKEK